MKSTTRQTFHLLLLAAISVSAAGGCGTETYNHRLDETAKLFTHINLLNENLGSLWSNDGVDIRMPRQFVEIPPPATQLDENGVLVQVGPDKRQPEFSPVEFPGLIGAWTGKVEAGQGDSTLRADAYAYIMSNAYLLAKGEEEDAAVFKDQVAEAAIDGLDLPYFEEGDWTLENYPETPGIVPQQSARVWVTNTEKVIDEAVGDSRYEISLHLFRNERIQVAVLFVYPITISPREQIKDRIGWALETIKISPDLPAGTAGAKPTVKEGGF